MAGPCLSKFILHEYAKISLILMRQLSTPPRQRSLCSLTSSSSCLEHENYTANMLNCDNTPKFRDVLGQCTDSDAYPWTGAKVIPYQGAPSSTSTVLATASVSAPPSQSTAPGPTQCPNPDNARMTIGLEVGLGVGIPLVAIAATFGLLWLSERKRRTTTLQMPTVHELPQPMDHRVYNGALLHEIDNSPKSPGELDGEASRLFGFGRRK